MRNLEERVQKLERMLSVSRELTSTVALDPLLQAIVDTAAELTESDAGSILLRDARTGELRFCTASNGPPDQLADIPVPIDASIAGTVLTNGTPLIVSDAQSDPRHYGEVGQLVGKNIHSLVAVPLQIKERCIGVLEAVNKCSGQTFTQEDVETLVTLGAQAAVAIENARLVEELRNVNRQLAELDQLKSDVMAIASHELRTPLSLILGYAAMLREQLEEETASSQLDVVRRAALRLKRIIETMLNLQYLETGKMDLSYTSFDLREEIRQVCQDYHPLTDAKRLTLEVHVPDEPLNIWADRDKLGVILDNMLSNAVKFTPAGGEVQVIATDRESQAQVTVIDNGVGIPQEALERIFEPFEQVEDHMIRQHGGMGLGLSIVKGLVELHGGHVWAESVANRGSRFVILLPVEGPTSK